MRPSSTSATPYIRLYNDREIQALETTTGNYATVADFTAADSSVNYLQVNATATGNMPGIEAVGTDTDIDIEITPKGTGVVDVTSALGISGEIQMLGANKWIAAESADTNVYEVMSFVPVDNAVNSLQANAAATGNHPSLVVAGSDSDINIQLTPKGTGKVQAVGDLKLDTNLIVDSNENSAIGIIATGSAVNYVQVTNAATGNSPTIEAVGTDADVDLNLTPKGIGSVIANSELFVGSNLVFQTVDSEIWVESPTTGGKAAIKLSSEDDTVNYVHITGTATGNPPTIVATGTDADIDIDITPKGNGIVAVNSTLEATEFTTLGANDEGSTLKTVSTLLTNLTGADTVAAGLIPDGAFLIGVSTRIDTAFGASNGTTGYQVGDGDVDRWGNIGAITQGTRSDNTNATADATGFYTAASDVTITAVGGNFDGTGDLRVVVHYLDITAPSI